MGDKIRAGKLDDFSYDMDITWTWILGVKLFIDQSLTKSQSKERFKEFFSWKKISCIFSK